MNHAADNPAEFMKRVKGLEIGTANNPWPEAIASSTAWALQQFGELTPEERLLAEEWRDACLAAPLPLPTRARHHA
ncbi:hypothetical protein [Sinorhizobium sp. BJ1]|uniref:hypothetical protein n=1 Tax=Sinorhizobium sp. BJ1 TaxID=2035455 RepID=UPI001184F79E|nr:hypothetical protein [Sinorhizobium sp. BJ1]